ncbi:MAG: hypothetical protein IJI60_01705 [Bacilli bacterium]|nr:hypothetical protein [Bacilli bacterium]
MTGVSSTSDKLIVKSTNEMDNIAIEVAKQAKIFLSILEQQEAKMNQLTTVWDRDSGDIAALTLYNAYKKRNEEDFMALQEFLVNLANAIETGAVNYHTAINTVKKSMDELYPESMV